MFIDASKMKGRFILLTAVAGFLYVILLIVPHYSHYMFAVDNSNTTGPRNRTNRYPLDNRTAHADSNMDINMSMEIQEHLYSNIDHMLKDHSKPKICSQQQRLQYLQEKCRLIQPEIDRISGVMITDSKRKLMYCPLSKAGCTTWKYLLLKADSDLNYTISLNQIHSNIQTKNLKRTGIKGSQWFRRYPKYQNYTKFVVVRHPLERILSGYHNSIRSHKNHFKGVYGPTIKLFKTFLNFQKLGTLSLSLFIEAITNPSIPHLYNNQHWRPYMEACNLCEVSYDHIIRIETMGISTDAMPILKLLGYDSNQLSDVHVNNGNTNSQRTHQSNDTPQDTISKVLHEYKDVPKHLMQKLLNRYKSDLELFGYRFNTKTFTASCGIPVDEGSNQSCC